MYLIIVFELYFDFLEMHSDPLSIVYTYKINKYNMPLYVFSEITECNKFYHTGSAFPYHKNINSYY